MKHPDRTHGVKAIESLSDLAEVLSNHKWPLCTGFEFDNFLYLNDGESEDNPEYAAFFIDEVDGLMVSGRETGRISPLGIDANRVQQFVRDMHERRWSCENSFRVKAEPDWHHSCELCSFEED
jgi:hypothetical protein